MKRIIYISLLFILFSTQLNSVYAQFDPTSTKYRIVAVKHGDETILSTSNAIDVYGQFKVDLPTAFTPNNDGLNDTFGAIVTSVSEFKLLVYDRNGEVIFSANSADEKWDGTYNGYQVNSGSYIYHVVAKGPDNSEVNKTGKVMVVI